MAERSEKRSSEIKNRTIAEVKKLKRRMDEVEKLLKKRGAKSKARDEEPEEPEEEEPEEEEPEEEEEEEEESEDDGW